MSLLCKDGNFMLPFTNLEQWMTPSKLQRLIMKQEPCSVIKQSLLHIDGCKESQIDSLMQLQVLPLYFLFFFLCILLYLDRSMSIPDHLCTALYCDMYLHIWH